ncbi:MAG: NADH-quinone oxidoreductase subunit J family protein, partial [Terriglobales bacterium]
QTQHSIGAFITALMLFVVIYMATRSEGWPVKSQPVAADNTAVIGRALTTDYALPFEFSSVLLLAALVGSIMLAKSEPAVEELEYSSSADDAGEPALTTPAR